MARLPSAVKGKRQHERALEALARRGRLRALTPAAGIDFTSNDYLGLADSAGLRVAACEALARGVPLGAGGSRLLRGNHFEHEALEAEAAAFFGVEAALYFGSGFAANAALIATLPGHGDLIVHDALIHASAWDGMGQTKATCVAARHNDVQSFDDAIVQWRADGGKGRVWLAVESLYSMDGDEAPLAELMALADRHDGMLLIDEAHATGVLGVGGRGLGAAFEGRENVVSLHTCGKALGASGALITSSASIRDFLVNRARAFIYATAPSPVMAAVVRRALGIVRDEPLLRERLAARVAFAGAELMRTCGLSGSGSQIMPVIVGADARAVALAQGMRRAGYDVRAIRPPTVPEGTSRLRIVVTLNTDEAAITGMFETLAAQLGAERGKKTIASSDGCLGFEQPRAVYPSPQPSPQGERGRDGVSTDGCSTDGCLGPGLRRDDDSLGQNSAHGREVRPVFVVTGTGTGVGKTVFAAGLVAALDGDYWKPVQAGLEGETDTQVVRQLSGLAADRFHAEGYRLATPASPHLAAELDGVEIDAEGLEPPVSVRPLVIEGAGGLMVPLTRDVMMIDVFARWQVPVILVASTALGTINHTLLSIEALRARGVPIHGVAFVGEENAPSEEIIVARGGVRRLGRLPYLEAVSREALRQAFAAGFDVADFRS